MRRRLARCVSRRLGGHLPALLRPALHRRIVSICGYAYGAHIYDALWYGGYYSRTAAVLASSTAGYYVAAVLSLYGTAVLRTRLYSARCYEYRAYRYTRTAVRE